MYRLRFIYVLLKSLLSKKRNLLDDFDLHFIALPLIDTDYTRLFTQTYALYMGLARWNFLFNSEFRTVAVLPSLPKFDLEDNMKLEVCDFENPISISKL